MLAAIWGRPSTVHKLLLAGADPTLKDNEVRGRRGGGVVPGRREPVPRVRRGVPRRRQVLDRCIAVPPAGCVRGIGVHRAVFRRRYALRRHRTQHRQRRMRRRRQLRRN